MSHRRRRLLYVAMSICWLGASGLLFIRTPGPVVLSEMLALSLAVVLTLASVIAAALAPVVSQNKLLATLVREHPCSRCGHGLRSPRDILPVERVVIPMRSAREHRTTVRADRV